MSWVVLVVATLVCLAIGIFYGAVPWKNTQTTESQQKYSTVAGIIAVGIVIILMMAHQDLASWFAIGAVIVGILVAKIPPLHRWMLAKFPFFQPAKPVKPGKKPSGGSKKRK
jgi:cell division protein FtsW (lipid II flippase)